MARWTNPARAPRSACQGRLPPAGGRRSRCTPRRCDQPGTGDAGGMNVYIVEVARRLAEAGVEVEIFTRATSSELPPVVEMAPGVHVRHVIAGPFEGLAKEDLPAQLCAFTHGVMRAEAARPPGCYDLVHSHYWLSGQVGWLAKDRWGVPLVHSAHTLAKVKNALLADGDRPEPRARIIGEEQVVGRGRPARRQHPERGARAGRAVRRRRRPASPWSSPAWTWTGSARRARPRDGRAARRPAPPRPARRRHVVAFVGRIQPLKAPDVLLRAAARAARPIRESAGGSRSWSAAARAAPAWTARPRWPSSPSSLGIADSVRFLPPLAGDDLADAVPAGRPGRRAQPQRVVRAGRAGGAGLRHAGRRRGRRRPGHRGARRRLRRAGRRALTRPTGPR